MPSFDIVSEFDQHEAANAVDQANREVQSRFDFKGVDASFTLEGDKVLLEAEVKRRSQEGTGTLIPTVSKRLCGLTFRQSLL